jgi:hypothetical protein
MAFDNNSSSISVDVDSVNKDGTVTVSFDINFTDNSTTAIDIAYTLETSSCAVFNENNSKNLTHSKNGLGQLNNSFNDPLAITGDCTDAAFVLKVVCSISGSSSTLKNSFPIKYNPTAAMALALHPDSHNALLAEMKTMVNEGIKKHVAEYHSGKAVKEAKVVAQKKAAKKKSPKK